MYQQHADVTFDGDRIVRCWCETITTKYWNLSGIRSLHYFIAVKNLAREADMKVHTLCYDGVLQDTPMHLSRGYTPCDVALPTVRDSYIARGNKRQLSESKLAHLRQMCTNFIPREHWHEVLNDYDYSKI